MKLYYDREHFVPSSELVLLSPFEKGFDDRFIGIYGDNTHTLVSIEECDYVILPYKYIDNPTTRSIVTRAKNFKKKVLCFFIDDSDISININNSILFRTSFYKSKLKTYERAMPCFKTDNFNGVFSCGFTKPSIGFCGQVMTPLRGVVIDLLKVDLRIDTDFIIRKMAWPNTSFGENKTNEEVQFDFYNNMVDNTYNLCIRGGGNFSYRLYETMMMGRIPIIIDTDMVLPFDKQIEWDKCGVLVTLDNLQNMVDMILDFHNNNDLLEVQKRNRSIYDEYLSPIGFMKNIEKSI